MRSHNRVEDIRVGDDHSFRVVSKSQHFNQMNLRSEVMQTHDTENRIEDVEVVAGFSNRTINQRR